MLKRARIPVRDEVAIRSEFADENVRKDPNGQEVGLELTTLKFGLHEITCIAVACGQGAVFVARVRIDDRATITLGEELLQKLDLSALPSPHNPKKYIGFRCVHMARIYHIKREVTSAKNYFCSSIASNISFVEVYPLPCFSAHSASLFHFTASFLGSIVG